MPEYGALRPPGEKSKGLVAKSKREGLVASNDELRDAERLSVEMAKLAASEAFSEVRELIGEVKALRMAGRLRDASASAKNLATTGAILTDKALLLEGRPTSISETRDSDAIWASIFKEAGLIESTAEEIPDAIEAKKKGGSEEPPDPA